MSDSYWEVFDQERPLLGAIYGRQRVRMFAFGLKGGGLCVVSPGTGVTEEQYAALERFGKPRFLLAPNHYHNGGLAPWQAKYPEAKVVSYPRGIPRLQKQVPGVSILGLEELQAALPEGVRLLIPTMAKQGEAWISAKTSQGTAWYTVDGIINEPRLPKGPVGWLMWVLGFRAGLTINNFFKRVFLEDKKAFKAWLLEQLSQDQPTLLIPSHGRVLRDPELTKKLTAIAETI